MASSQEIIAACLQLRDGAAAERIIRLLVEMCGQVVGADEGSVLLLAPEDFRQVKRGELVFAMTVGNNQSELELLGLGVPVGKGITGMAALTREVQIGGPVYALKSDIGKTGHKPEGDPKTVMAAPMLLDDELIGVITAVTFNPQKRFNKEDAVLYGRMAAVAGVVIGQQKRLQPPEVPHNEIFKPDLMKRIVQDNPSRSDDLVLLLETVARLSR